MSSTYAKLEVSVDGGKSQTWSKLAPISATSLQPVKWDLKSLREKNQGKDIVARVSLVDGSASEVIGVGEWGLGYSTSTNLLPIAKAVPDIFDKLNISKRIYKSLNLPKSIEPTSPFGIDLGLDNEKFEYTWRRVVDLATSNACSRSINTGRDINELAKQLEPRLYTVLGEDESRLNEKQCNYFIALFACYWVANNSDYYTNQSISAEEQFIANAPFNSLRSVGRPQLQCNGFSVLTRDLAEKLGSKSGLTASYVWGWFRHQTKAIEATPQGNHAWVLFDIGDGIKIPSDPTTLYYQMKWGGGVPKSSLPGNVWAMPIRKDHLEVFHSSRWGLPLEKDKRRVYDVNINPEFTNQYTRNDPTMNLTWDDWRRIPLDYIKRVEPYLNQSW